MAQEQIRHQSSGGGGDDLPEPVDLGGAGQMRRQQLDSDLDSLLGEIDGVTQFGALIVQRSRIRSCARYGLAGHVFDLIPVDPGGVGSSAALAAEHCPHPHAGEGLLHLLHQLLHPGG